MAASDLLSALLLRFGCEAKEFTFLPLFDPPRKPELFTVDYDVPGIIRVSVIFLTVIFKKCALTVFLFEVAHVGSLSSVKSGSVSVEN
jgi:hypothetical protein